VAGRRTTGDSLAFARSLAPGSVHLVATDPPWTIPGIGGPGHSAGAKAVPYALQSVQAIAAVFAELRVACIRGAHAYVFMPSGEVCDEALAAITATGWIFQRWLMWDKAPWGGGGLAGGAWRNSFEPVAVLANGHPRPYQKGRQFTATLRQRAKMTRTSKPPSLYRVFLEASTAPGELAVDPWCGLDPLAEAAATEPARSWVSNDILTPAQVAAQARRKA
jgi:DNA modification methylase